MDTGMDFLNFLQTDMSTKILTSLDDPADLARISSVSRAWRQFVVENSLWKQLCLRTFPQLFKVARIVEVNNCEVNEPSVRSSKSKEWETLDREHRAYAKLGRWCTPFAVEDCVSEAISASSTDNFPEESILHTLEPRDVIGHRASYWSSTGQSDPSVPETLTYKLVSNFCVITEISVQPFKAYFQPGSPIYSARNVRFRIGHPKNPFDLGIDSLNESSHDDKFIWTYTSEKFRMTQENILQKFKLPEPILCIGGILQIELLGRVQRQQMDGLFYICVSHVEVVGQSLFPALDVEVLEPSGTFVLKNDLQAQGDSQPTTSVRRARQLQHIVDLFDIDIDPDYEAFLLEMEQGGYVVEEGSDEEFVL